MLIALTKINNPTLLHKYHMHTKIPLTTYKPHSTACKLECYFWQCLFLCAHNFHILYRCLSTCSLIYNNNEKFMSLKILKPYASTISFGARNKSSVCRCFIFLESNNTRITLSIRSRLPRITS